MVKAVISYFSVLEAPKQMFPHFGENNVDYVKDH